MSMQVVILAGGLATRMLPLTRTVPKILLEVAGRPFVDWQLERLAQCGYRDVLLCVGYLGEQVEAHVGDGERFGVRAAWAFDGPKLLGTWGALRAAIDRLEETFLLTYGDSYLPFDYAAPLRTLRAHDDCDGVMSVYRNDGKWDVSNVESDGAWVRRYEKKSVREPALTFIDYGALALRRSAVGRAPADKVCGLDRLQHALAREGRMRAVVAEERFFEIGSPEGLAALEERLRGTAAAAKGGAIQ